MHDLLTTLFKWSQRETPFALATVIKTSGSSPRPVGSILAVDTEGQSVGSVSAGCVEGYVIERCLEVLETGKIEICTFGAALPGEPSIWDIGLSCHGQMDILINRIKPHDTVFHNWLKDANEDRETTFWQPLPHTQDIAKLTENAGKDFSQTHFPLRNPSADKLLIFGANHIAAPLISFAKILGMRAYLIDPRDAFTSEERFPDPPDQLFRQWPEDCQNTLPLGNRSYAVLLSHDPKLDHNALAFLLKSEVAYIGALGSRSTQKQRKNELRERGFTDEQISRIHGPVGLDVGAQTPAEIAASILAQIISVKRGGPKWKLA